MSIRREDAVNENDAKDSKGGENSDEDDQPATAPGKYLTEASEYQSSVTPEKASPATVDGVLARADVDPDHWLGAGVAPTLNVLVQGSDIYTPIRLDMGTNVARFQSADELLASGYLWEQNRKQLAYKPFVVAQKSGKGFVIGFTQNPNVRAYLDGLNVIFMNAIYRGSAHARPLR